MKNNGPVVLGHPLPDKEVKKTTPCGGCGATKNSERCMNCLHDFGDKESEWVRKYSK